MYKEVGFGDWGAGAGGRGGTQTPRRMHQCRRASPAATHTLGNHGKEDGFARMHARNGTHTLCETHRLSEATTSAAISTKVNSLPPTHTDSPSLTTRHSPSPRSGCRPRRHCAGCAPSRGSSTHAMSRRCRSGPCALYQHQQQHHQHRHRLLLLPRVHRFHLRYRCCWCCCYYCRCCCCCFCRW